MNPAGTATDARLGLRAAFRLAVGLEDGVDTVPNTRQAAIAGFWAVLACLPLLALLHGIDWRQEWPARPRHQAWLSLFSYLVGWFGYALLSRQFAQTLNCAERWPRFVAVWSWCNLVQYVVVFATTLPELLPAPEWGRQVLELVTQFWALWLEYQAARLAFGIPRLQAAAFVAVDVLLSLMLAGGVEALG